MTKRNVVHIEIPAQDPKKAGEFYKNLFGWELTFAAEMNYMMWDSGHGSSGGFIELSDSVKPGDVILYVESEDIDADLKQAELFGASIVQPRTEIPATGWFGMFKDPTGNVIALYTGMNPQANS